MQCFSRCFIFQKVHTKSEPNKQVKTQNLLGFSIFSLIYKIVMIFFAMPVFLSTCYKKTLSSQLIKNAKDLLQFQFLQNQGVLQQSILRDYCTQSAARKDSYKLCPRATTTSAVTVTSNCSVLCLFYRTLLV